MHATVVVDETTRTFGAGLLSSGEPRDVSEPNEAPEHTDACPTDNSAARTARITESRELADPRECRSGRSIGIRRVLRPDQFTRARDGSPGPSRSGFLRRNCPRGVSPGLENGGHLRSGSRVGLIVATHSCSPTSRRPGAFGTVEYGSTGPVRHHEFDSRIRRRQRRSHSQRRTSRRHRLFGIGDGDPARSFDIGVLRRANVPRSSRRPRRGDTHDKVTNPRRTTPATQMSGGELRWTKS
jgi:hypothetical protein